ncbi:MAG: hypothetical protein ACW98K_09085 [Candidatus Kariarchaeaceae archaeon]|jgi:hypothetical protein
MNYSEDESKKKEKVLRRVYSKILKSIRIKDPLEVAEAEKDRKSVENVALGSDNIILLEIDKETYSGFVELQKMRDDQKIGDSITPRQRTDRIANIVSIHCSPIFSSLSKSRVKNIINAVNRIEEDVYDEGVEVENRFLLASDAKMTEVVTEAIDVTEIENMVKSFYGKSFSLQQFANSFDSNELLLIPLILSRLNYEFVVIPGTSNLSLMNLQSIQEMENIQYRSLVVRTK